jgi:CBS-domain-containing membrane protein
MRIENMMHTPAITIGARDTVETAASLMARHGIHALPVVNAQERLIGIVTTTDIISAALHGPAPSTRDQSTPKGVAAEAGGRADAGGARLHALEAVLHAADRYLSAGQDERLHSQLLKTIETAKRLGPAPPPPAGSMV